MEYFLERLPGIMVEGIASDLDGTLVDNKPVWFKVMSEKFGMPDGFTIPELIKKYGLAQNVPKWQTLEAFEFLEEMRTSNEMHFTMPQIKDSSYFLNKISSEIVPVSLYNTIRPEMLREGTERWLRIDYPSAPVAMRPDEIPSGKGNEWKAKTLEKLFPTILGIIDDNPDILNYLSEDYEGIVFLYSHDNFNSKKNLSVIPCPEWKDVYENVKNVFA